MDSIQGSAANIVLKLNNILTKFKKKHNRALQICTDQPQIQPLINTLKTKNYHQILHYHILKTKLYSRQIDNYH